jgi:glutathione S-transferase
MGRALLDLAVATLELDDGRKVTDSVGICLYLEEMHPQPPLMGVDPADRQRRAERDEFLAVAEAFRNSTPAFKARALPRGASPGGARMLRSDRGNAAAQA